MVADRYAEGDGSLPIKPPLTIPHERFGQQVVQ